MALPLDVDNKLQHELRIHSVVSRFLEARAEQEGIDLNAIRRQAAMFLKLAGEWREAITYALAAGNPELALAIAEEGGGWRLIYQGEYGMVRQFEQFSDFSPSLYEGFPKTSLGLSISAAKRGDINLAAFILDRTISRIDPLDQNTPAEGRLVSSLIALYQDRPISALETAQLEADIVWLCSAPA